MQFSTFQEINTEQNNSSAKNTCFPHHSLTLINITTPHTKQLVFNMSITLSGTKNTKR